ncbi:MAG: glutathione S-transferase family protein [Rhodocyclaceae bacterium]|jgi:glutathione S-transferase|nr:glutathione S-transferase family protein [Rhodocyclaceae bacterium]MBK6909183.1 glutathione S-transferase family protein [Rhodocyclaceae bacterium]
MIQLWHSVSARSFRPLWLMEEMGLPYQLHMLPFPPRVRSRAYLETNPLGTVPWLVDGETCMSESAAMCEYIAARHGPTPLHVNSSDADFGSYLNFLHFGEATLTFPQTLVLRYQHFEPPERCQPQVVEDYSKWFLARLRTLETRLAAQDFLCSRFTAADISVGYALLFAQHLGLAERFTPSVAAYWQRLQQRPAYQRAVQRQHHDALTQGIDPKPTPDTRLSDMR